MKLCISLISCLLLAAGCKTDAPESEAPSTKAKETTADTGGRKGRSGKIDFERPRAPRADRPPSLQEGPPSDENGSSDRRDRWEERRERMAERRKERMAQIDTNGDGTLSPEELTAARAKRAEEMHGRFDANNDGKLTADELKEARMFRRNGGDPAALDTDKNGEISNAELEAGMQSMRDRFRRDWDNAAGRGSNNDP
ncbi:MAG: hypothetical protein SFX73_21935 [Kofleriaceae bacterium]|nr:hypothetical protein [Kofleriaceae bacterium]